MQARAHNSSFTTRILHVCVWNENCFRVCVCVGGGGGGYQGCSLKKYIFKRLVLH